MPCCFRMTSIMPAQSVIDVFAGADVPPARLRAMQNVHVKHDLEVRTRAGGIRTHDLLNPIQAFYQAELQPVLRRDYSLTMENSPGINAKRQLVGSNPASPMVSYVGGMRSVASH